MNMDISNIISDAVAGVINNLPQMSLSLAKKLAEKIEEKAAQMGVNAVVAISDAGARTVLVECMDNSYYASYDIAVNKAYTSVSLKMPTKDLAELAKPGGSLYGIQHTNNGKIVIFGGGVPLKFGNKVIGGVGVSGGTAKQDTELGDYALTAFTEIMKGL
ncbi:MAG: heme-binding protein [Clostridia bacterium]|nr:heme-binding protein [Clostridia bacterium]